MKIPAIALSLLLFTLPSCKESASAPGEAVNSVYYWRTTLDTDSVERAFLRENDVRRAYVRFFDIVVDESPLAMDPVVPNASLEVKDSLPVGEIIPTIYITNDAIRKMRASETKWAGKIVRRVFNMCSYNGLPTPRELQLDCDWTESTDTTFFNLCKAVKEELSRSRSGTNLSSTIRLHQLSQTPPPVDRGVLMVYNTGSFMDADEPNSILTVENVRPYLKYLSGYRLPLDYAYPIFSWKLVYSNNQFRGILSQDTQIPDDVVKSVGDNKFELTRGYYAGDLYLGYGDIIKVEAVPFETIKEVQALISKATDTSGSSTILYSLDSRNISNYSENEFAKIYK